MNNLTRGSPDDIPVRPGDVIIVPASGSVLVQGWVRTPGAYPITPGMTEYGAITAAGGAMFSSTARLLRANHSGERTEYAFDLAKIEQGQEPDIQVESGDVVVVNKSADRSCSVWCLFFVRTLRNWDQYGRGRILTGSSHDLASRTQSRSQPLVVKK